MCVVLNVGTFFLLSFCHPRVYVFLDVFRRFLCTTLLISTMALTPTSVCLEFYPREGQNYAFSRLINQQNRGKHQKINQKSFHFSMKILRGVFPPAPAFFSFLRFHNWFLIEMNLSCSKKIVCASITCWITYQSEWSSSVHLFYTKNVCLIVVRIFLYVHTCKSTLRVDDWKICPSVVRGVTAKV